MTITKDQVETWSQHPLVTTATRRLGDNYSALDLFEELHGIMTDLEDRFPSIPFADILACHDPGTVRNRQQIQTTLIAAGVTKDNIEALIGPVPNDGLGVSEYQLALSNVEHKDLIKHYGYSVTTAGLIRSLRQPITAIENRVLDMLDKFPDMSMAELERRLKLNRSTVRKAVRKGRYQLWAQRQGAHA